MRTVEWNGLTGTGPRKLRFFGRYEQKQPKNVAAIKRAYSIALRQLSRAYDRATINLFTSKVCKTDCSCIWSKLRSEPQSLGSTRVLTLCISQYAITVRYSNFRPLQVQQPTAKRVHGKARRPIEHL